MTFPFLFACRYASCKHISLEVKSDSAHTSAPVRTGTRVERASRGLSGACWSPWPAGLCSAAPADCKQITHTLRSAQEEQEMHSRD